MDRKWWTLGVVSVATFMLLLDITVVNVALPSIEEDLDASFLDLQWVVDAYTLTLAAFVLTAGVLADRLGRRRVFAFGLVVFSIASLGAALSGDPTTLNIWRATQGVGGAVMFAVSLSLIAVDFKPGRERGQAMGIYGATIGAAVAIGPLVGGALTDSLGWESIFLLNVPIGVAALAITYLKLGESRDPKATHIDWWGQLTFSAFILMLVLALLRGNGEGWGSALILSLFAGSAIALALFIAVELRGREPMLPLGLFKIRSFTGVQIAAAGISSTMFALFLYITLYLQNFLGLTAFEAGLRFLPITMLSFFAAAGTGAVLVNKIEARYLLAGGLGLVGAGLFLMSGIEDGDTWTTLLAGFIVAGAGIGIMNPVVADVAVSVVPSEVSGMAAGANDTFRQLGIAIGIALWGAIFIGTGQGEVEKLAAGTPAADPDMAREIVEATSSGSLQRVLEASPADARAGIASAANEAFLSGFNQILVLGAALAIASGIVTLLMVREEEIERDAPA